MLGPMSNSLLRAYRMNTTEDSRAMLTVTRKGLPCTRFGPVPVSGLRTGAIVPTHRPRHRHRCVHDAHMCTLCTAQLRPVVHGAER